MAQRHMWLLIFSELGYQWLFYFSKNPDVYWKIFRRHYRLRRCRSLCFWWTVLKLNEEDITNDLVLNGHLYWHLFGKLLDTWDLFTRFLLWRVYIVFLISLNKGIHSALLDCGNQNGCDHAWINEVVFLFNCVRNVYLQQIWLFVELSKRFQQTAECNLG